uniref:tail fiber domain-containing protein n=1 Tax=Cupriavidus ulmosensis TaxID=3065913 RepID=UPI00296AFB17|nr:tail fiber domain-containing protein [Cupriavidus sp. CV2]
MFTKPDQNKMTALGKLAAALFGTSTIVNGLSCVPTGPASMQVIINPGEIYSQANIEASVCGTLPADTTHQILKQGILLDAFTTAAGALAAPGTAGQSINYLIQAQYADSDVSIDPTTGNTPVVLQFYNASNPTQPWSGPGGNGQTSTTFRKGIVSLQVKAGIAATTGTQTTPAPDAGYTGLWVVTVANGQTTITSTSIAQAANAPILPADLLHAIQQNALTTAVDTGTANAYAVSYSPPITALTDGMVLWFKAKTANNGASTLNVNGLGTQPLVGGAHAALQGGEIVANGKCQAVWRADISSFVLLECTGGALQVAPGTASGHAVQTGKPYFQTSTANSATTADAVPSGSGVGGGYRAWGAANQLNCAYGQVTLLSTEYRIDSGKVGSGTALPMTFVVGGAEQARFDTSGNLLIGKTVTAFGTVGAIYTMANGSLTLTASHGTTVVPVNVVSASGTENAMSFSYNSSVVGSVSMTASATAFNTSSDYRLKENVVPLTGALERLNRIPVRRFNFKVEPSRTVDGFLAHEAQAVVPEAVTGEKDAMRTATNVVLDAAGKILAEGVAEADFGSAQAAEEPVYPVGSTWVASVAVPVYQAIDQSKLVPLLVAAIQELKAEFDAYKAAHP